MFPCSARDKRPLTPQGFHDATTDAAQLAEWAERHPGCLWATFYFLWAARLEPSRERLETLVSEAQALVNTYLDGAGIFAWQERRGGGGYEALTIPASAHVTDLDDVLHRIATVIRSEAPTGEPPPPEQPAERAVPPEQLPDDAA